MTYRIINARPITPEGILTADLIVSDGVIERLLDPSAAWEDVPTVDAEGCYVSPGFVDIHQHGGGGADYMDATPDTYTRATEAHLRHGTTSVLPTLLSADTDALLRAIDCYKAAVTDPAVRVHLLGLHLEGPYISPAQAGAQKPEHIRPFIKDEYERILAAAEGHVRRFSVAPEVEGVTEFAARAAEEGITLSIAHSNATLDEVERAFALGFRHITHLYSCVSTITRRGGFRVPGVLEAAYLLDEMDVEIIADGCHLPTSLLAFVAKFKDHGRIALITDAMRAAGEAVTESFLGSPLDPLPVVIEDGVAKLTDRTAFAGSIATADRLIREMQKADVPLTDAVRMMSENPLRMMHLDVKKGRIAEGYDADLCFFDEEVRVRRVLIDGETVFRA